MLLSGVKLWMRDMYQKDLRFWLLQRLANFGLTPSGHWRASSLVLGVFQHLRKESYTSWRWLVLNSSLIWTFWIQLLASSFSWARSLDRLFSPSAFPPWSPPGLVRAFYSSQHLLHDAKSVIGKQLLPSSGEIRDPRIEIKDFEKGLNCSGFGVRLMILSNIRASNTL